MSAVPSPLSPSRFGSFKSQNMVSNCKSVLNEQHNRLQTKHNLDIDLMDDLRTYIKAKCNIERDYAQALIKLSNHHQAKKYPQFLTENDSTSNLK